MNGACEQCTLSEILCECGDEMTPDELKKEAERLLQDYGLQWDKESVTIRLANALRAVHNAAIEKAADHLDGYRDINYDLRAKEIRALKIGDGK